MDDFAPAYTSGCCCRIEAQMPPGNSVEPGAMALTRMPCGAHMTPSFLAWAMSAALAAVYPKSGAGSASRPEMDDTRRMVPPPASVIHGITCSQA